MRISNGIQNRNRRMRNRTYGGVRGRKTKVGRKLLRFPPTRLPNIGVLRYISICFYLYIIICIYNYIGIALFIYCSIACLKHGCIDFFISIFYFCSLLRPLFFYNSGCRLSIIWLFTVQRYGGSVRYQTPGDALFG